jgi:hypothetical protein
LAERNGAGDAPRRHHPLDELDGEVDDGPFGSAEHVAKLRDDDLLDLGLADDLREDRGEILEDDDRLGAGVLQLMLELSGV